MSAFDAMRVGLVDLTTMPFPRMRITRHKQIGGKLVRITEVCLHRSVLHVVSFVFPPTSLMVPTQQQLCFCLAVFVFQDAHSFVL